MSLKAHPRAAVAISWYYCSLPVRFEAAGVTKQQVHLACLLRPSLPLVHQAWVGEAVEEERSS